MFPYADGEEERLHGGKFLCIYLEEEQISTYKWVWEERRKIYILAKTDVGGKCHFTDKENASG